MFIVLWTIREPLILWIRLTRFVSLVHRLRLTTGFLIRIEWYYRIGTFNLWATMVVTLLVCSCSRLVSVWTQLVCISEVACD